MKKYMTSKQVTEFRIHLENVDKYKSVDYKLLDEYKKEQLILNGVVEPFGCGNCGSIDVDKQAETCGNCEEYLEY